MCWYRLVFGPYWAPPRDTHRWRYDAPDHGGGKPWTPPVHVAGIQTLTRCPSNSQRVPNAGPQPVLCPGLEEPASPHTPANQRLKSPIGSQISKGSRFNGLLRRAHGDVECLQPVPRTKTRSCISMSENAKEDAKNIETNAVSWRIG